MCLTRWLLSSCCDWLSAFTRTRTNDQGGFHVRYCQCEESLDGGESCSRIASGKCAGASGLLPSCPAVACSFLYRTLDQRDSRQAYPLHPYAYHTLLPLIVARVIAGVRCPIKQDHIIDNDIALTVWLILLLHQLPPPSSAEHSCRLTTLCPTALPAPSLSIFSPSAGAQRTDSQIRSPLRTSTNSTPNWPAASSCRSSPMMICLPVMPVWCGISDSLMCVIKTRRPCNGGRLLLSAFTTLRRVQGAGRRAHYRVYRAKSETRDLIRRGQC